MRVLHQYNIESSKVVVPRTRQCFLSVGCTQKICTYIRIQLSTLNLNLNPMSISVKLCLQSTIEKSVASNKGHRTRKELVYCISAELLHGSETLALSTLTAS